MQDVAFASRVALSLIFLTASLAKLRPSPTLSATVREFSLGIAGPQLSRAVARVLPLFELALSLLLLSGVWVKFVSLIALSTLALFTLSMSANLLKGNHVRCNCFGGSSSRIGAGSLTRNLLMVAGCLTIVATSPLPLSSPVSMQPSIEQWLSLRAGVLCLSGISLFVLLLALGEIDSLFSPVRTIRRKAVS